MKLPQILDITVVLLFQDLPSPYFKGMFVICISNDIVPLLLTLSVDVGISRKERLEKGNLVMESFILL